MAVPLHYIFLYDVSSFLLTCDTPEADDSARLLWLLAPTIPTPTLCLCWPVNMSMEDSEHREWWSWLVFRIPFGCCIRLCWSLDDIPANYRLFTSPSPKFKSQIPKIKSRKGKGERGKGNLASAVGCFIKLNIIKDTFKTSKAVVTL